jgi:ABC-2 type transport system ATP-binding protein
MPEKNLAIEIKNLTKIYDNNLKALDNVDLNIKQGEFFALLGQNGAGKSTLINCVNTLNIPTSGQIKINGFDLKTQTFEAKKILGVVPQEINLDRFITVYETMIFQGGLYGLSTKETKKNAEKRLKEMRLWDKRKSQIGLLSGGMKRRLMIARSLIHNPKVLFLDEPTAGVDIEIRHEMWDLLQQLNKKEKITIILTTHYLEEAELLCKKIAIIKNGKIIKQLSASDLNAELQNEILDISIGSNITKSQINNLKKSEIEFTIPSPDKLHIIWPYQKPLNSLFEILTQNKINISQIDVKQSRLERLFLSLTD